jgi:DNA mismatch repair protein MutS
VFATHYHELTALAAKLDHLACRTMRVKEWQGEVVFLHEVADGAADRSYGIHVARLAGLPEAVLTRAEDVLHRLEQGEAKSAPAALADDLPLFAAAASKRTNGVACPQASMSGHADAILPSSPVLDMLDETRPDDLTPKEALDMIYRMKSLLPRI